MATIISYAAYKRGASLGGKRAIDPVIAEIIDALLFAGGSAHRQTIAGHIASTRAGRTVAAPRAVQDEVFAAFDAYMDMASQRPRAPLLSLPLGAGSYRWSLTPAAEALFLRLPATATTRQGH